MKMYPAFHAVCVCVCARARACVCVYDVMMESGIHFHWVGQRKRNTSIIDVKEHHFFYSEGYEHGFNFHSIYFSLLSPPGFSYPPRSSPSLLFLIFWDAFQNCVNLLQHCQNRRIGILLRPTTCNTATLAHPVQSLVDRQ
jgi:hypothetical protein